nr:coiled-coil domain-containing protein 102A-like [Anolis sagrei ordinatus]
MHGYSWSFRQSRCPQRAQSTSPLFGIHSKDSGIDLINNAEDHRQPLSPSVGRRHSLSRLPNGDARKHGPLQPLARRRWSGSGPDLRRPFREEGQRESETGAALWSRERNLEVELNLMQFELFSLKQKMENSLAHLEKEKKWLETSFLENRKQEGDLDKKIFNVEMELEKTKTYLGQRNQKSLPEASTDSSQNGVAEKVALHQQVEQLTLELECIQKQKEAFQDQVSALCLELSDAKSQVHDLDKEKVLMKEELESTRQAKEELLSEVAESRQRLEDSLGKLHHMETEKNVLDNRIQALESERSRLLDEREAVHSENQADGRKREEETKALQESCGNLRESQALQQRQKECLQATSCQELEVALHRKLVETENQLAEQKQVSLYWKERWEEAAAALKTKEEELEAVRTQSQAFSAKADAPLLLQIQLDACKQELELERSRSQALHHQIQQLQPSSQSQAAPPHQGRHPEPGAKAIRSPQQEQESLKLQHQLVTQQLKGIFRQRAQQKQSSQKSGRLQEGSSAVSPASQGTLVGTESLQFSAEGEPESQDIGCSREEAESLRQQLKQNAERISSMASEIEALKQKNENLVKGKLRFQQQIQEIRRLSRQQPEKGTPNLPIPRSADKLHLDFESTQESGSSLPSPQSDEPTITMHGQEKLTVALQHPSLSRDEDKEGHLSADGTDARHSSLVGPTVHDSPVVVAHLQLHPDVPDPSTPSIRLPSDEELAVLHEAPNPAESEGAFLRPQSPALLSPRPFGLSRPWSPFKSRASPEHSDN